MSVDDKEKRPDSSNQRRKRRILSAEKKYQIFLESQRREAPVGEILRREGLYSSDLIRIQRKVKEGALQSLAKRPGPNKKSVAQEEYESLKKELQEKYKGWFSYFLQKKIERLSSNNQL